MPFAAGAPIRLRDFIYSSQLTDTEREAVLRVSRAADEARLEVCVVGGAVRDWLMGEAVDDIDIVVDGDAIPFARALEARHGGHVHVYDAFRTTTWHVEGLSIDITTARTETYAYPAALPSVHPSSLHEDFRRRDFTVNALALQLGARWLDTDEDALLDPHGGLQDLRAGLLRAFHPLSFVDDPTRIIRAARYQVRFNLELEARTRAWLEAGLPHLRALSGERVKYDLELHFVEPHPERSLAALRGYDAFRALGVAVPDDEQLGRRFERLRAALEAGEWRLEPMGVTPSTMLHAAGWGALTYNMGQLTASRLLGHIPFERHVREALLELGPLSTLSSALFRPDRPVSGQHALLQPFAGLSLFLAWLCDSDALKRHALKCEWRDWRWVKPATTGDDLRKRGLTPGPAFRRILDGLRDAWLDGTINSLVDETEFIERLIAE